MASFIQEVVAIIDRSGSMCGKEADTIGGINATLEIIKQDLKPDEQVKPQAGVTRDCWRNF